MDYLRSAYSTTFHAFDPVDGSPRPFTATWYRAPAGAQVLPVQHQYASLNWTKGVAYQEQVGEVIGAPRPWSDGATPAGVTGQQYCGTTWTGQLERLSVPQDSNKWDQPICCGDPTYCAPAFPLANLRIVLPDGVTSLLFTPRGADLQSVQDPNYPFFWVYDQQDQPCGAFPSGMGITACEFPDGRQPLFAIWAIAQSEGNQATWRAPGSAPYYGGELLTTVWSDA